jgi:hypothetical protein
MERSSSSTQVSLPSMPEPRPSRFSSLRRSERQYVHRSAAVVVRVAPQGGLAWVANRMRIREGGADLAETANSLLSR